MGQWDMYFYLTTDWDCPKDEAVLVSGLTAQEIADETLRNELELAGVDPDNVVEVAMFERHHEMTRDMLDARIELLEAMLIHDRG